MAKPHIDKELIESCCVALHIAFKYPESSEYVDEPVVQFDAYGVEIYWDEERKFPWILTYSVVTPGVRYRSDGTGEPDDVDVVEVSSHQSFQDCLIDALALCAKKQVEREIDALAFESMSADEEGYKDWKASRTESSLERQYLENLGCKFETDAGMVRPKMELADE